MRIKIDFDSDEIRWWLNRRKWALRKFWDPYWIVPDIFRCSCGTVTVKTEESHTITKCPNCHASNPRFNYQQYLYYKLHNGGKCERQFGEHPINKFGGAEMRWRKTLREIDKAKTADRKKGLLIGRRPKRVEVV